MSEHGPVRETEVPAHPEISTGALLGAGDVDRLSAMLHALMEEVADLSVRLARVEAEVAGRPGDAPRDLPEVQAHVAALIARVTS
jgi:hypothetical protein